MTAHPRVAKAIESLDGTAKALGLAVAVAGLCATCLGAYHSQAVAPAFARVDRLEEHEHTTERDRSDVLSRLSGVEVRLGDNTRVLRRIESKLDRLPR
jgi:hypothetical protein